MIAIAIFSSSPGSIGMRRAGKYENLATGKVLVGNHSNPEGVSLGQCRKVRGWGRRGRN